MTAEDPPPAASGLAAPLVVRPSSAPLADDVRSQQLWLSLQKRRWRSLAVLSASKGVGTLTVANNLAKIAWWYSGQPSCVFDMRDLSLRLLEHQLRDMSSQVEGAERVFIALRSAAENPTAVPLARAADACVLCVQLGRTNMTSAQKTLDAVGRDCFIGTILVPPDQVDADGPPHGAPPGPDPEG
jgi:hypothetical protein